MNARKKLNAACVHGIALIALVIGGISGSWVVGLGAAAVLMMTSITGGQIRIRKHRR